MKILAIETSAKACSTAVIEDGKMLCSSFENEGLTHSVSLMPMLDEMLQKHHLSVGDMDVFAISNGPGSFTGLRIGVSALKGLAWANEKPCCGVSTLEAMAQNGKGLSGLLVCCMDARRNQIYNALFEVQGDSITRLCEDRAISLEELFEDIKNYEKDVFIFGDGASLCYTFLQEKEFDCTLAEEHIRYQNAQGVAQVAQKMADEGKTVSSQDLKINYLRLSQAERERLAKGLPITLE